MSILRTLAVVPALLLSLSLSGCDMLGSGAMGGGLESTAPSLNSSNLNSYTRIEGQIPSGVPTQLSRVIGPGGGVIDLAGYRLSIPAGAVSEPAAFTISLLPTGFIEVDLSALSVPLGKDVGEAGFNGKRVTVTLPYSGGTNIKDAGKLLILRMLGDNKVEALKSSVDTANKTVTVELDHFSRYCLASN